MPVSRRFLLVLGLVFGWQMSAPAQTSDDTGSIGLAPSTALIPPSADGKIADPEQAGGLSNHTQNDAAARRAAEGRSDVPNRPRREQRFDDIIQGQSFSIRAGEVRMDDQPAVGVIRPQSPEEFQRYLELGEREGVSFARLYKSIDPDLRNAYFYNDLLPDPDDLPDNSVAMEQVLPGQGHDGPAGTDVCTGPSCGGDRLVFPGQECTEEDCPTAEGSVPTCDDAFCSVRKVTNLDRDADGASDITYIKSAYPEVLFMRKRFSTGFASSCTATMVANNFAITALHCFNKTSRVGILDQYEPEPLSLPVNWSELVPKDPAVTAYQLVSDHSQDVAVVVSVFVPYRVEEVTREDVGHLPTKDIALIRFEHGLRFLEHQLPILEFEPPEPDFPISFVGFGWTDVRATFGTNWTQLTTQQKWRELKQAAFNFVDDVGPLRGQHADQVIWNHGDPPGAGGPCNFDSGGPIYKGFNRGFWNSPRIVVGVVSALHSSIPAGVDTNNINACLSQSSFLSGELLANFKTGICAITKNAPRGC